MAQGEVTQLLVTLRQDDQNALDRLFPLVHAELRRAAGYRLARERVGHALQLAALLNEAFLKRVGQAGRSFQDRAHFVAGASRAMRQVVELRAPGGEDR